MSHSILKADDHKPVDFNGQTETFTCQPIKTQGFNWGPRDLLVGVSDLNKAEYVYAKK